MHCALQMQITYVDTAGATLLLEGIHRAAHCHAVFRGAIRVHLREGGRRECLTVMDPIPIVGGIVAITRQWRGGRALLRISE